MKKYIIGLPILFICQYVLGQSPIGHTTITFQDPERGNRNIETEIYYPAQTAGNNTAVEAGTFPVIVFGHGFVMSWDAYQNLWEEFVPRGYIMVFPRTEGNILSTDHQQFGWDLEFLVTEMQNEGANSGSILFNAVASETALMGHSMGGGAAFLAADSLSVNGNSNIKTLIGFAPAESSTNGVSSINSALSVTVPSIVLSGSQDGVAPPIDHHIPMYDALASDCKSFINIVGGAHCYFANTNFNCDFGEGTSSTGISITREDQHAVTFDFVNLWLDYTLKNNCVAFNDFNSLLAMDARVTYEQDCTMPTETIQANGATSYCEGDSTELTSAQSLEWSTGETGTSIFVNQSGGYYAFNPATCATSNTILINVQSFPDVTVNQTNETLTAIQTGATYQWIDCSNNQEINGETDISYTASSNGDYAIEITLNSCVDTSSCANISSLSISSVLNNSTVNLYPNPAKEFINIYVNQVSSFSLLTLEGKNIGTWNLPAGKSTLEITAAPGIYLWQTVSSKTISNNGKLVVE